MDQLQTFLDHGWVGSLIGIVGTLFGIVGILIAIWTYRLSKIGPRPVFETFSQRIIGSAERTLVPDIVVIFRGNEVKRLSVTRIFMWNSGNATINGSNIVKSDPLRVTYKENGIIMDVALLKSPKPANNASIKIDDVDKNVAVIDFDYLDPKDGAVFEILHTDSRLNPQISGTIRGIPKGITVHRRLGSRPFRKIVIRSVSKNARYVMVVLGFLMVIVSTTILFLLYMGYLKSDFSKSSTIIILVFGIIYMVTGINLMRNRRIYPKSLILDE